RTITITSSRPRRGSASPWRDSSGQFHGARQEARTELDAIGFPPRSHGGKPQLPERVMNDVTTVPLGRTAMEPETSPGADKPALHGMVLIPGGVFLMGSDRHYPEEAPAHRVSVEG